MSHRATRVAHQEMSTVQAGCEGPAGLAWPPTRHHRRPSSRRKAPVSTVNFEEGSEVVGDVRERVAGLDYEADTFSRGVVTSALGQVSKEMTAAFSEFDVYATERRHAADSVAPELLGDFVEGAIEAVAEALLHSLTPMVAIFCGQALRIGLERSGLCDRIEVIAKKLIAEAAKLNADGGQLAELLLSEKRFELRRVYRSIDGDRLEREAGLREALVREGIGFPLPSLRQEILRRLIEKLEFTIWVSRCRGYGEPASMVRCASGDDEVRAEVGQGAMQHAQQVFPASR